MTNYTAWVKTPRGPVVQVYVQAPSSQHAKLILESQHGQGNIVHLPMPA